MTPLQIARICSIAAISIFFLVISYYSKTTSDRGNINEPQYDVTPVPTPKTAIKSPEQHAQQKEQELQRRVDRITRHPFFRALTGRCVSPKQLRSAGYRLVGRMENSGCSFPHAVRYDAYTLYDNFLNNYSDAKFVRILRQRSNLIKTFSPTDPQRKCLISNQCAYDPNSTHCSKNIYEKCSTSWWYNNSDVGWTSRKCSANGANYFIASRHNEGSGKVVLECYLGNAVNNYEGIKWLKQKKLLKSYLRLY